LLHAGRSLAYYLPASIYQRQFGSVMVQHDPQSAFIFSFIYLFLFAETLFNESKKLVVDGVKQALEKKAADLEGTFSEVIK